MPKNAYILLVLTALFFAGNAVAGKLAVGHVSPMALNGLRWPIALALLLAVGWRQLRRDWPSVSWRDLVMLGALGAAGFSLFNAVLYTALQYTSAINVTIEQAAMPMVIFIANFLLFSTRVSLAQIAGFGLSVLGVAITASHGDLARLADLDINFGDALMIGAVLLYGGYTVALRFKPQLSWQTVMIAMVAGAALSAMPMAGWEYAAGNMVLPDARGWVIVAYVAIFPSILSQVFYLRGVETMGGNRAGLFINLVPIFGALLSVLVIGEAFRLYHALAMVMVLGGIWLAENSGRKMAR